MSGKLTEEHMEHMRVPKRYWRCKLSKIPDECQHKGVIQRYIINMAENLSEGIGFLFYGDYDTGKTGSAVILLKAACAKGYSGLYTAARDIPSYFSYRKEHWFSDGISMKARILDVDFLVIDELILHEGDTWRDTVIEEIIRDRAGKNLVNILTTNLAPVGTGTSVKANYPALHAILQECAVVVKVHGHNFRTEIKEKLKGKFYG